jgi:hypothetical protein
MLSRPDYAGPAGAAGQQPGWQRRRGQSGAAAGGHQGHPFHVGLGRVLTGGDEQPEHAVGVPGGGTQQPPGRSQRQCRVHRETDETGGRDKRPRRDPG